MTTVLPEHADIVVVGGGNAALCSALTAAELGASVVVLERAPIAARGGNGVFTAGFLRFSFDGIDDVRAIVNPTAAEEALLEVGRYTPEDFFLDVAHATDYRADPDLVDVLVSGSLSTVRWLRHLGVPFLPSFGLHPPESDGKVHLRGQAPAAEVSGGGAGLIEALYRRAEASALPILYQTRAISLVTDDRGGVTGVTVRRDRGKHTIGACAVVLASGGFEASSEMRARYLGPDWDLARVRGSKYNTGDGITMALQAGAQAYGNWTSCHASPTDLNSPAFGDRNLTDAFIRRSYHLGIMVNRYGRRFVDEGEDLESRTYAKYGREIIKQPSQMAFQVFDSVGSKFLRPEYSMRQATRITADSLEELAGKAGIDAEGLRSTVEEFNQSVNDQPFDPTTKDGKSTSSNYPPKSNWAMPISSPPFLAFPVTCAITFTYGGIRVNSDAQVMHEDDYPIPGLFAAGELVGGLFYGNYPAGCGITGGAVFGRIAGASAAKVTAAVHS